ncbi:hypothetical protein CTKZ_08590 [Cellulomonas algicola]|uniref:Uncharacterized protein n=1 Tax=Cellulomonas algicola TaxID=2071633 RepID=A0A401UX74_9CELL|nr:hypothetical protein CTKZ_08590 [Cellulomonas algicola]
MCGFEQSGSRAPTLTSQSAEAITQGAGDGPEEVPEYRFTRRPMHYEPVIRYIQDIERSSHDESLGSAS